MKVTGVGVKSTTWHEPELHLPPSQITHIILILSSHLLLGLQNSRKRVGFLITVLYSSHASFPPTTHTGYIRLWSSVASVLWPSAFVLISCYIFFIRVTVCECVSQLSTRKTDCHESRYEMTYGVEVIFCRTWNNNMVVVQIYSWAFRLHNDKQ
jgi:hypothetical protein